MPLAYRLPLFAALALCSFVGRAVSTPCPQAETIVQHAYLKAVPGAQGSYTVEGTRITLPLDDKVNSDPRDVICKVWPSHPELTLAAVPLIHHGDGDDPDTGDLDVLVLDTHTLAVRHRLRLLDIIKEDATPTSELSLDTARYRLSATTTAFGLLVSVDHGSIIGSFSETDLLLLAIIDGKLRLVLPSYAVAMSREDDDSSGPARCPSDSTTSSAVLNMAATGHAGFADINVTEDDTEAKANANANAAADSANECPAMSEQNSQIKTRLTFDGQTYRSSQDKRLYIPHVEK